MDQIKSLFPGPRFELSATLVKSAGARLWLMEKPRSSTDADQKTVIICITLLITIFTLVRFRLHFHERRFVLLPKKLHVLTAKIEMLFPAGDHQLWGADFVMERQPDVIGIF